MGKKSYRNDYRFVTETGQICTDFSVICNACNDSHPITYVTYMYYRSVICNTENFLYYRLYNPGTDLMVVTTVKRSQEGN